MLIKQNTQSHSSTKFKIYKVLDPSTNGDTAIKSEDISSTTIDVNPEGTDYLDYYYHYLETHPELQVSI